MLTEHFIYHVAALQERDRLARELHDSLAQDIGYIKIKAALISQALRNNEIDRAQAELPELMEVVSDLYTDVREEILSLRVQISNSDEFLPKVRNYLEEFQRQYTLETELKVAGEALVDFPARTANQLFRIIQEALNNIRKHAQASRVTIRIEATAGQLYLIIEDNGLGFDPARLDRNGRSFGLKIMEERAESIGGHLAVDTAPGVGTRLSVSLTNHQPVILQPGL